MSLLVTPSLLNGFDWLNGCPASWKDKAHEDFEKQLKRIYDEEMPEPIRAGVHFEKAVYAMAHKKSPNREKGSQFFWQVVDRVKDGAFQQKTKKYVDIDGLEYCLYGKIDVRLPNEIVDIKTTTNYRGQRKYLDGWQHIMYTFTTGVSKFTYLVVEWQQVANKQYEILDLHEVTYDADDRALLKEMIVEHIKRLLRWLEVRPDLKLAYEKTFSLYN